MILLRKIRPYQPILVFSEVPTGEMNGFNKIYSTDYNFVSGKIEIIYNGQSLYSPDDIEEIGNNSFSLKYVAPDSSDVLRVNYEMAE